MRRPLTVLLAASALLCTFGLVVAAPEHVSVALGLHEPVSKLDAATGETVETYPGTTNTWERVLNDGTLYALTRMRKGDE